MNEQDKTTFTPEEIRERFNALPENLQSVAESEELANALTRLGNQHAFSENDINALQDIVGLIVLGLIPRASLKEELDVFGLPEKETEELARELNAMVFDPLKTGASSSLRGDGEINTDVLDFGVEGVTGTPKEALDLPAESSAQAGEPEEGLNRDALLAEIEDGEGVAGTGSLKTQSAPIQKQAQTPSREDAFSKKIREGGGLPRTESRFEEDPEEKKGEGSQDPTKHSGYEVDPYREPIE